MKFSFSASSRVEDGNVVGVPLAARAKAAPAARAKTTTKTGAKTAAAKVAATRPVRTARVKA